MAGSCSTSRAREFIPAIQACELARTVEPDNAVIQQTLSDLSARYTLFKGKYGDTSDFSEKVADLEGQQKLMEQDHLVQSDEFLLNEIARNIRRTVVAGLARCVNKDIDCCAEAIAPAKITSASITSKRVVPLRTITSAPRLGLRRS